MPVRSIPPRTRAVAGAAAVIVVAVVAIVIVVISGDDPEPTVAPATTVVATSEVVPTTEAATDTTVAATAGSAADTTEAPPATVAATVAETTPATAAPVATPPAPPVEAAPAGNVLFSTSFDVPGTALDNGMLLPSFGPHLTPRPGVVANGAIFRDPAMTEWEDVLVRAPVGPLSGDRYIEAVVTVASNGADAHPAIMFFDDPPNTSGGCAGGSTMDWAEVDPWNNMQAGRISFVIDGCYDATSHVFAGVMGSYRTYTVRAEIVGGEIVMKLDGAEIARTTIPAGLDLPFAGLRLGQFGEEGGFDQYRIESFEVGLL